MQQMAPSCLQNEVTVLGKILGVTTHCLHILFILFRLMAHIDRHGEIIFNYADHCNSGLSIGLTRTSRVAGWCSS